MIKWMQGVQVPRSEAGGMERKLGWPGGARAARWVHPTPARREQTTADPAGGRKGRRPGKASQSSSPVHSVASSCSP